MKSAAAIRASFLTLLERKPFDQITVREIARGAGVHYATFFRHHPDKEDLLTHVAAGEIDRLVALTEPLIDDAGNAAAVAAIFAYVGDHRGVWTALITGGAAETMRQRLLRVSRRVAAERAPDAAPASVELGVNYSVSLIFETLAWWLAQPHDADRTGRLARTLNRLLLAVQSDADR